MLPVNQNKPVFSAIRGAQVGLTVTLFALLAACGHKPIDAQAVDETPIAANEVAATPDSELTPVPGAEDTALPAAAPQAHAPVAHKAKHHVARRHARRRTRIAKAHHKKAVKKAAAVGQIQNQLPPPPAPKAPEAVAPTPVMPAPTTLGALQTSAPVMDEVQPSHRSWWIWSLVIGASLALLVIYRTGSARRSRRLVFNS